MIAATEVIEADQLSRIVEATFAISGTHPLPESIPAPPASWAQSFAAIAAEAVSLSMTDLWDGRALTARFWNAFLTNAAVHQIWLSGQRQWRPARGRSPNLNL